jgi:triacylglycerol lipase
MKKLTFSAALICVLAFVVLAQVFPGGTGSAAPAHDPVLFVHGYGGTAALWDTMINHFKEDGWTDGELFTMSYDSAHSNVLTAGLIKEKVDGILAQTGAERVDLVTHSMGGLSTRYYLKFLGGASKVDAWVSLGGPNHGTAAAGYFLTAAGEEMRRDSDFLLMLNQGDETPGNVAYATWWSSCDEIIYPRRSVLLAGAQNTRTNCMTHLALLTSRAVYTQVRDWIALPR